MFKKARSSIFLLNICSIRRPSNIYIGLGNLKPAIVSNLRKPFIFGRRFFGQRYKIGLAKHGTENVISNSKSELKKVPKLYKIPAFLPVLQNTAYKRSTKDFSASK